MSVKERTAAIRMILTGSDTENWHMLETYLTETTEKDRTAIARSLGGMYGLYEAEGPTLRMLYLWAALASNPEYLAGGGWADTLDYWGKQRRKTAYPVYTPAVMRADKQALNRAVHAYTAGLISRGDIAKRLETICASVWNRREWVWRVCRTLAGHLTPDQYPLPYLRMVRNYISGDGLNLQPQPMAERIVRILTDDEALREKEFWAFFTVEGMGDEQSLEHRNDTALIWDAARAKEAREKIKNAYLCAFSELCERIPGFRDRLLEATLTGTLSDFSARNVAWYVNIHRYLKPTSTEISVREPRYAALLTVPSGAAVALGQNAYKTLMKTGELGEVNGLIEASRTVLARTDKKSVKAQLSLLRSLNNYAKKNGLSEVPQKVSALVNEFLPSFPVDTAEPAKRLIIAADNSPADSGTEALDAENAPAEAPIVPGPRAVPLPDNYAPEAPVTDAAELNELMIEHLLNAGNGADLPRILDAIITLGIDAINAPTLTRIKRLARQQCKNQDNSHHAGTGQTTGQWELVPYGTLLACALATVTVNASEPEHASWDALIAAMTSGRGKTLTATSHLPNRAASTLLIRELDRFTRQVAGGQATVPFMRPVPQQQRQWTRKRYKLSSLARAWEGHGWKAPLWFAPAIKAGKNISPVESALLGGPFTRTNGNFGVADYVDFKGEQRVYEWMVWALRHNLDTLAAHAHMSLIAGMNYPHRPEIRLFLNTFERTGCIPGEPVYSALGYACRAKNDADRAAAAEAIAGLCASNLLDPHVFAEQLKLLMADGAMIVGRLAKTLDDAAQLNELAGYRVLQTLHAMLQESTNVVNEYPLVALLAQLCVQYGVSVPIPDRLIPAPKARGTVATALRTILALEPHPTELLAEAAQQAEAANRLQYDDEDK